MSRHVRVERGALRFSGECASCRPVCHAVCCRSMRAKLSDKETASGRYASEVVDGVTVLRHDENGCVYLKGSRCSIYEERPAACRRFDCSKHLFKLYPITAPLLRDP